MNHLHAPQCKCTTCSKVNQPGAEEQKNDTSVLSQLFPNASDQQLKTLLDLSKMNKLPSQVVHKDQQNGSSFLPSANKTSENPKPIELKPLKLGQGYQMANGGGGGKIHTERLSEPARKQSRKVGFPPPVASYYQRKESSNRKFTIQPQRNLETLIFSFGPANSIVVHPKSDYKFQCSISQHFNSFTRTLLGRKW